MRVGRRRWHFRSYKLIVFSKPSLPNWLRHNFDKSFVLLALCDVKPSVTGTKGSIVVIGWHCNYCILDIIPHYIRTMFPTKFPSCIAKLTNILRIRASEIFNEISYVIRNPTIGVDTLTPNSIWWGKRSVGFNLGAQSAANPTQIYLESIWATH